MKKRLSIFLKRAVLLGMATVLWTTVRGQVFPQTVVTPGSYGSPVISTGTNNACMDYTTGVANSKVFTFSGVTLNNPVYSWRVQGGIDTVSTSGASATVIAFVDSRGRYNKGRLIIHYKGTIDSTITVNCSGTPTNSVIQVPKNGYAYVDLYQKFDYDDPIIGNVCVANGDSNAYSIKDLVSGNIEIGIGIDSYFWDYDDIESIIDGNEPSYSSGDSSALTFRFTADPAGGEQIKVKVGRCNLATPYTVKTLAPKLPSASYSASLTCVKTSVKQITILNNPVVGIKYKWVLLNPNYTFAPGSTDTSSNGITVNIGVEAGIIYLVSTADPLTGSYCNEGSITDTLKITRALDSEVEIFGDTCISPGLNLYTLDPNPNTPVTWILPPGFTIPSSNLNASTVAITVASNALSDTIKVVTKTCDGPLDTIRLAVHIAPAAPGPITGDTCLVKETNETFSINKVPNATGYSWTYPSGFTPITATNDTSITFTIASNAVAGTISVAAIGCGGPTAASEIDVNFAATRPGTITRNPAGCINRGIADTIVFTAANCVEGQTYEWVVPSGWTKVSPINACSLTVYTDGVVGTNLVVKARGVNDCQNSVWDSTLVDVAGVGNVNITVSPILDENDNQVGEVNTATNISAPVAYQWYQAGVPISGETTRFLSLEGSNTAEICVRVTKNGCMTQRCRTSNFAARVTSDANASLVGKVKLFPNPVSDLLKISVTSKFVEGNVVILNANGVEVKRVAINSAESDLDVSNLNNGTYVVVVTVNGNSINKKLQIMR